MHLTQIETVEQEEYANTPSFQRAVDGGNTAEAFVEWSCEGGAKGFSE